MNRLVEYLQWLPQSRYAWFLQGFPSLERAAAFFRIRNYTMTTVTRCRKLWELCQMVVRENIPGAFVECGVWKGGSAGLMALAVHRFGSQRPLHLFDSFEGLPEPTAQDGAWAAEYSGGRYSGALQSVHQCEAGIDVVRHFLFDRLRIDPKTVIFHRGWFQETMPALSPSDLPQIAILRLDGDWYESTKVCLDHLYDRLVPGGVLLLDDYYCWEGCQKATEEFRKARGITTPVIRIDAEAAYWRKESA